MMLPIEVQLLTSANSRPLRLSGGPCVSSPGGRREWRGRLVGPAPLVCVTLLASDAGLMWTKSNKRGGAELPVRVLVQPYDRAGLDVQVSCSVGTSDGHVRSCLRVPSAAYFPEPACGLIDTGVASPFLDFVGEPSCRLAFLPLLRSDVLGARNGSWNVKPESVADVAAGWVRRLRYGRTGRMTTARRGPAAE